MMVTIDLALLLLDIATILLIVVLPAVFFLLAPNSSKAPGGKSESNTEAEEFPVTSTVTSVVQHSYDECFVEQLGSLPNELQAKVAEYLKLSDVAAASSSCQQLRQTFHTVSVWQTLGHRYDVHIKSRCMNRIKDEVRLAARQLHFKTIKDLAIEVKRHPPRASVEMAGKLFSEANRFMRRLQTSDGDLAMELCDLLRPCLNCHSSELVNEAKEFMQSARQSALPWVALQDLESSYGHGVLHHNLFESCMQDHEDMLEAQLSELEASIAEESKILIDYDLDALLSI